MNRTQRLMVLIVNLTDHRAKASRHMQLELLTSLGPDGIARELAAMRRAPPMSESQPSLSHLDMPGHHDVRGSDIVARRLYGNVAAAADRGLKDFPGARTVRALAMVAEVVHGAPYRFSDPARFSFAHGGKDGHPFPVPVRVYDETIRVLKSAVQVAKLGRDEELGALKQLDAQARLVERCVSGPPVQDLIAEERRRSHFYGGRSVFGWAQPLARQTSSDRGRPRGRNRRRGERHPLPF
jgi:hypothetical protein